MLRTEDLTVDTNVLDYETPPMYVNGDYQIGIYVADISGTHDTHVIIIQESPNDLDWFDTAITLTGLGKAVGTTTCECIRAKVTTAEGGASSSRIVLNSK